MKTYVSIILLLLTCSYLSAQNLPTDYTTAQITGIQSASSAAEGDLYHDYQQDIYYLGTTSGELKEIGILTEKGTSDGQKLVWNNTSKKWEVETATNSLPQILLTADRTTNYTPANNSFTTLAYNSASINVGNAYNTSNGAFTAPADGLYEIQVHNTYRAGLSTDNRVELIIQVNGSTEIRSATTLSPYNRNNNAFATISEQTTVTLTSGQTIAIQVGNELNSMQPQTNTGQHRLKIIRLK